MLNRNLIVAVEDIKPYSLPLNQNVVDTCKWIGEACYRLKNDVICDLRLITRYEIKRWVFDSFPEIVTPLIDKKIAKGVLKGKYVNSKTGENRAVSFHFVDDRIVTQAMTKLWGIDKGIQGKKTAFGLKGHSFQALAVASYVSFGIKV